jgi:ubiquinone/menaquinone biosynthesis C-methylase UbiE
MVNSDPDPTERFTGRSSDYKLHRPRYPDALFQYLLDNSVIWKGCSVADVGSGTGIFAKGLLDRGVVVYAVEPNHEMRECADDALGPIAGFHSVVGRSEATTLGTASVDAVTAAFHWFDTAPTRIEFSRILRPGGQVCIVYNERDVCDPFSHEYEGLVGVYTDPDKARRERSRDPRAFFGSKCKEASFPTQQELNRDGLLGRVLSNSHMPKKGEDGYEEVFRHLSEIFDRHQENGRVILRYNSHVYHGTLE